MPSASTIGDAILPHGCWSGGTITGGSGDVLVNGKPVARVGDPGSPHSWICPKPPPPHPVSISGGSGSVLVNGMPVARVGDPTSCGTTISSGSGDVLIGG